MLRSILYATDLGLYAPYVLQHALSLAKAFGAELHVVHAVEPMGLFAESVLQTYLDEKTLQELRSKGLSRVMASIELRVLEGFRDEMGGPAGHADDPQRAGGAGRSAAGDSRRGAETRCRSAGRRQSQPWRGTGDSAGEDGGSPAATVGNASLSGAHVAAPLAVLIASG